MSDVYNDMDAEHLRRLIRIRDRQAVTSRRFWVRAGKAALDGDTRELRNRIELAEAPPLDLVLSEPPVHVMGGGE